MNKNEKALNQLKKIIGDTRYKELCEEMPGVEFRIPKAYLGGCTSKDERNRALRQDYYSGLTLKEVADKWEMSASQAQKIIQNIQNRG